MPFYDFYSDQEYTALGKRWMQQSAQRIMKTVSQTTSPLRKIVEIGPGSGALARHCSDRKLNHIAIDANVRLLSRLEQVDTICSRVPPIPLQDRVCDVAIASHVIEHCNGLTEAQELISEMKRIVRIGGCIAIVSPDILWAGKYFWDCDYSHNFPISSRRLYQMFWDQGLEVIKLEYLHNHLTGLAGYLTGRIVNFMPYRFWWSQPSSMAYFEKVYRLRMTFSRSVQIIGRRRGSASD